MNRRIVIIPVIVCWVLGQDAVGQQSFRFVDVGQARGIGRHIPTVGMGAGVAAADYDNDGFVDVFVPQAEGIGDKLYHNLGGLFEERAAAAGLATSRGSRAGLWLDYDGDGWLDLMVVNDVLDAPTAFRLYRQSAKGAFVDATETAGVFKAPNVLYETHYMGGLCAGDINNDGYVDVFAQQWYGPAHLFLNRGAAGPSGFIDTSDSSGVTAALVHGHQSVMADFDSDGWMDIFAAVDFAPNRLWINRRDGTFLDQAAEAGLDNAMNDMGVAVGDYDGDGDFDVYVTNIDYEINGRQGHNVLHRNDSTAGTMAFTEVSAEMNVQHGFWGWGATFLDADNDGLLDLAATNGWQSDGKELSQTWSADPSRFFRNTGGPESFADVADVVGFNDAYWGSALVAFDYDRDGDSDLMLATMDGPLMLMENRPTGGGMRGNYLVVQPRMAGPNRFAIGAVVRVEVGGRRMMRMIQAGTSFLGQEPAEAFLGLGTAALAENVTVEWPGGGTTTLTNVCANQVLRIEPADRVARQVVVDLIIEGPLVVGDSAIHSYRAIEIHCEGVQNDVTTAAEWTVAGSSMFPVSIMGGSLQIADVDRDEFLAIRVRLGGLERMATIKVVDSASIEKDVRKNRAGMYRGTRR